jgi:hypothetical protein
MIPTDNSNEIVNVEPVNFRYPVLDYIAQANNIVDEKKLTLVNKLVQLRRDFMRVRNDQLGRQWALYFGLFVVFPYVIMIFCPEVIMQPDNRIYNYTILFLGWICIFLYSHTSHYFLSQMNNGYIKLLDDSLINYDQHDKKLRKTKWVEFTVNEPTIYSPDRIFEIFCQLDQNPDIDIEDQNIYNVEVDNTRFYESNSSTRQSIYTYLFLILGTIFFVLSQIKRLYRIGRR